MSYSKAQENAQGTYPGCPPPTYSGVNPSYPSAPGPYPTASSAIEPPTNQPINYTEQKDPRYNYQAQPQYSQGQYPGQNPSYHSDQHKKQQTPVISQQPQAVAITSKPGFKPSCLYCPNCKKNCVTQCEYESGAFAWLGCAGCFILGCWLGCCLIPFCVTAAKDVTHYCPECRTPIAHRSRL